MGSERVSSDGTRRTGTLKLGMYQKAKGVPPMIKKAIKAVVEAGKDKKDIIFQVNSGSNITVSQTSSGTPPQMFFFPQFCYKAMDKVRGTVIILM